MDPLRSLSRIEIGDKVLHDLGGTPRWGVVVGKEWGEPVRPGIRMVTTVRLWNVLANGELTEATGGIWLLLLQTDSMLYVRKVMRKHRQVWP